MSHVYMIGVQLYIQIYIHLCVMVRGHITVNHQGGVGWYCVTTIAYIYLYIFYTFMVYIVDVIHVWIVYMYTYDP